MPRALGKVINNEQARYLREMLRNWERESGTMLARMKQAIDTRLARDPRRLATEVDAIGMEMSRFAEKLQKRRDSTSGQGRAELDAVLSLYADTHKALAAAVDSAYELADGKVRSSVVAEKMYELHGLLTDWSKASRGYRYKMELQDMVSDKMAEELKPAKAEVDLVDFAKSLEMSHRKQEYARLVTRLPSRQAVDEFTLIRFPVVPITAKMAKAASFEGAAEVDPVTFRDAAGKMRVRYLIFKHQLVMAVNTAWLEEQRRVRRIYRARDIAKFAQSLMDTMSGHMSMVSAPTELASRNRERIIGQGLVSFTPGAHRKAPGLTFFWFAPRRDVQQILNRTRQIKSWTLALV